MIKLPPFPFASSIVGGEQHSRLVYDNDSMFNLKYFAKLYMIHKEDIPLVLTRKLTLELVYYTEMTHKDLVPAMFDRLVNLDTHNIVCLPLPLGNNKKICYETLAYHCNKEADSLEVVFSFMVLKDEKATEKTFIAFSAVRGSKLIGITIHDDAEIPIMIKLGWSKKDILDKAWHCLKFISTFEAILAYKIIGFQELLYDAMLQKKGVCLNPNYVRMNLLALDSEKGIV